MKTCIFIYDDFVQFEVILSALFLKKKGDLLVTALEDREYRCVEGFTVKPDIKLENLTPEEIDVFIIPGGNPTSIYGNPVLTEFVQKLDLHRKVIAAICAGPVHLGKAGILVNTCFTVDSPELEEYKADFAQSTFVNENVVMADHIITAKPSGYVDLAVQLAKTLEIYTEEELQGMLNLFKYHQDE